MTGLAQILVQFLFRLSLGVAGAMFVTSPKQVTSGFFRVHSWVTMGLAAFAAVILYLQHPGDGVEAVTETELAASRWAFWTAVSVAVLSYMAAVVWLYEAHTLGRWLLLFVSLAAVFGASQTLIFQPLDQPSVWQSVVAHLDLLSGSFLVGTVITAMFLGHWYLNTPTMDLEPLRKLLVLMGVALSIRGILCAVGFGLESQLTEITSGWWVLLALRWLAAIVANVILLVLTWQTLKIPNTQSATGILYAAVIFVFIGELSALLLSCDAHYPL